MTKVIELLGRFKQLWVWFIVLAIVVAWGYTGVRSCLSMKERADAAIASAHRQQDLALALNDISVKFADARRKLEAEQKAQDDKDMQDLSSAYERVEADGSAANVLNDLIRAGELP